MKCLTMSHRNHYIESQQDFTSSKSRAKITYLLLKIEEVEYRFLK